jgi:outer membrane protein W
LQVVEIGLDYQIRNTVIIGVSINHDLKFDATYVGLKLGIRVF